MNGQSLKHANLAEALIAGDVADASRHIARGEKAHQVFDLGQGEVTSLLHLLTGKSEYDVVEFLLNNGAQVNYQDSARRTALHLPASTGDARMVTLLLTHGADPDVRENSFGHTPLHNAAVQGRTDVVKALIGFGARPDARANNNITPLMLAAHRGHHAVAQLLGSGNMVETLKKQFAKARAALR